MSEDKCPGEPQCPFCGADEDMRFGTEGIYYKCGTSHWGSQDVRITGVRQWRCYKTEGEQLKDRLQGAEKLLQACQDAKTRIDAIHHDGLPAKYAECYWGMKEVFPEIETFLSTPADAPTCTP